MGIGAMRAEVWACLMVLGMLPCGCDSRSSSQTEQLASFESIEQRCWRYLGGIKSRFEISGTKCGVLKEIPSERQDGRRGSIVLGSGRQDGSRGSIDNSRPNGRRESVDLSANPVVDEEWKESYVKACQDAIGLTAPFTTARAIKNDACVPELVQQTCQAYSHANVPNNLENISKLVVLDSLFSGMFMTKCLSVNSSGISVLNARVGKLGREALAAAGEGVKKAVNSTFKEATKQVKERATDPKTWQAVAAFAFGLFAN